MSHFSGMQCCYNGLTPESGITFRSGATVMLMVRRS